MDRQTHTVEQYHAQHYSTTIQTHTQTVLWPFIFDHPVELVLEEIFFCTFMVQAKITEADTLIIRLGSNSSRLISDPPSSPHFYAGYRSDALKACHNPPTLSWLGTL